ncbi:MAG: right-handed parallel beta-helix repeat-containing protein, partial [Verrucomicrobia bacterium]|nr:right-handed parallel beta-helix repeat-containing protein [Verrucomicrobiota bacterium]
MQTIIQSINGKQAKLGPDSRLPFIALVALAITFVLVACCSAETYYVDSISGSDELDGKSADVVTEENGPWQTLAKVNAAGLKTGDDVYLRRGCTFSDAGLVIRHSGTESDRVVIGAYGEGDQPIIDTSSQEGVVGGIYFAGPAKSHITVQDIAVHNVTGGQSVELVNATDVEILNLTIHNNASHNGILALRVHELLIDGVYIRDVGNSGIALIGSATDKISDVTVRNCDIARVRSNDGITIHEDDYGNTAGANFLLENNLVEACGENGYDITTGSQISMYGNVSRHNGDGGILVDHTANDVVVLYHESYDEPEKGGGGIIIKSPNVSVGYSHFEGASYHFVRVYGNADGAYIFNNLFIVSDPTGVPVDITTGAENVTMINNIFYSPDNTMRRVVRFLDAGWGPTHPGYYFDHNLYWGLAEDDDRMFYAESDGELSTLAEFQETYGQGMNSMIADPMFVSFESGDYSLRPGSPAADAGNDVFSTLVTVDAAGSPVPRDGNLDGLVHVDIGRFEIDLGDLLQEDNPANAPLTPAPVSVFEPVTG